MRHHKSLVWCRVSINTFISINKEHARNARTPENSLITFVNVIYSYIFFCTWATRKFAILHLLLWFIWWCEKNDSLNVFSKEKRREKFFTIFWQTYLHMVKSTCTSDGSSKFTVNHNFDDEPHRHFIIIAFAFSLSLSFFLQWMLYLRIEWVCDRANNKK